MQRNFEGNWTFLKHHESDMKNSTFVVKSVPKIKVKITYKDEVNNSLNRGRKNVKDNREKLLKGIYKNYKINTESSSENKITGKNNDKKKEIVVNLNSLKKSLLKKKV